MNVVTKKEKLVKAIERDLAAIEALISDLQQKILDSKAEIERLGEVIVVCEDAIRVAHDRMTERIEDLAEVKALEL